MEVIDLGGAAGDLQARGKCRRGSTAVGVDEEHATAKDRSKELN